MAAQQSVEIYNPLTDPPTRTWMNMTEFEAWYATLTPEEQAKVDKEIGKAIDDAINAWSDDEDDGNKGIYHRENEPPPEDEDFPPPPPPPPDEELPPPSPRYEIIEGLAPENMDYTANVKIDNETFGVYAGNPIPTNENLTLNGCTTLVGAVKNLGKNTVTFKPWTYTVYATWSREELMIGERQKIVNGKLQYDENNNPIMEEYTYWDTISGVESVNTPILSGAMEYYKIRSYTNWGTTTYLTVFNESFGTYTFVAPKGISYEPDIISDDERIVENEVILSGYEYAEDAKAAAEEFASKASIANFWTVKTDTLNSSLGEITYNGAVSDATCNLLQPGNIVTAQVKNNSVDGTGYTSSGLHEIKWLRSEGLERGWGFTPNSVRIHTPIHNTLTIKTSSNNELSNKETANGNKIVTLDEEFTIAVELNGSSHYYTSITTALEKYVQAVYIDCGICGNKISGYTHTCTVPITRDDNKIYQIKSIVIAKNACDGGQTANAVTNNPDEIYTITQSEGIYVAGKIYDLEVRTVDDKGWKLKEAEKLSKLPTGEYKDNMITAYKYGVKLGYRAYFDLKTLRNSN